jgi:hypothetical protein
MSTVHAALSSELLSAHDCLKARFRAGKAMARGYAQGAPEAHRVAAARAFCRVMVEGYWAQRAATARVGWAAAPCFFRETLAPSEAATVAQALGQCAAAFDDVAAGYLLGTVYTAMLPSDLRAEWGAFYTPPQYVERLLDQAAAAGVDWSRARVADPACGGGAFLAPVALRMWGAGKRGGAEFVLADVASRLRGFELDPFAAWMSHVTLEAALLQLCVKAKRRMPNVIAVGDSLAQDREAEFDLVVGNPPYGKVKLTEVIKARYARSLYGHANLYGLFTDLAIRLCRPGGVVAFVTPTSFLGGQYFKALRRLLLRQAPPLHIDFIGERAGVFDDVLQETLLVTYGRGREARPVNLFSLTTWQDGHVRAETIDAVGLRDEEGPWLLPRAAEQALFFRRLRSMDARLADYGYQVSTGPLVWNRHRLQLRQIAGAGARPLIWAESVSVGGFEFSAKKKNHVPYIAVHSDQPHLVTKSECVLVQRTTAKEQERRLICAVLPKSFIDEHDGVVVENHVNIVRPLAATDIKPQTVAAVLNSQAADFAFRCISGSVAVSAYELEALPLPGREDMLAVQHMLASGATTQMIERRIGKAYGVGRKSARETSAQS